MFQIEKVFDRTVTSLITNFDCKVGASQIQVGFLMATPEFRDNLNRRERKKKLFNFAYKSV
jgi:hypothetical protein